MASNKPYQSVKKNIPGRSIQDLTYAKLFNCDMGQLIPVVHDEVVPGDIINIGNEIIIRAQPLVAPVLHEINATVHYFFIPYRLLWTDWEKFITGGPEGDDNSTPPTWEPDSANGKDDLYSLWDYFGFPKLTAVTKNYFPLDFPRRGYNFVFNHWYRDETLQTEVALDNEDILIRNWEKDYFTSSLPWQQRGVAPALPISGFTSAEWTDNIFSTSPAVEAKNVQVENYDNEGTFHVDGANAKENAVRMFNTNTVDLSSASTFDVSDLRLVFQIQKWLERNARSGARYTEFLQAHFGVSPTDERLDRPEYIGGTKQPIIISEVLQTSSTDAVSPQGNLAGHGISADNKHAGKYRVEEYGMILGLMSIMPRTQYSQGINRQWWRETRYDFYSPEFANLSEQAVLNAELYYTGNDNQDDNIFGYQGRYDEMRTKQDLFCGAMRDTLSYWHLGRKFDSLPGLNETFIKCIPRKDIFAVPSEPGFIVHINNLITAVRPLPIQSEPGLVDH